MDNPSYYPPNSPYPPSQPYPVNSPNPPYPGNAPYPSGPSYPANPACPPGQPYAANSPNPPYPGNAPYPYGPYPVNPANAPYPSNPPYVGNAANPSGPSYSPNTPYPPAPTYPAGQPCPPNAGSGRYVPYPAPPPASAEPPSPPPPSPEQVRQLKKGLRGQATRSGLVILVFFLVSNLVGGIGIFLLQQFAQGMEPSLYNALIMLLSFGSTSLVAIPVGLLVNSIRNTHRIRDQLVRPKASGSYIFKWIVIGFGCTYAVNYIFNFFFLFLKELGVPLYTPSMVSGSSLLENVVTFFFFALAAPLMEELLFRGGLLGNLRGYGEWLAIVFSALLFGLTHMNYQQIFYAAALGIFSGFLCCKARSLWPSIGIHFAINLIGAVQSIALGNLDMNQILAFDGSDRAAEQLLKGDIAPLLIVACLVVVCLAVCITGVILFIIELVKRPGQMRLQNGCPGLRTSQKLGAVFTSWGFLLALAVLIGMTILNASGATINL